jgi:hypothetical protein
MSSDTALDSRAVGEQSIGQKVTPWRILPPLSTTLTLEAAGASETSVRYYKNAQCHILATAVSDPFFPEDEGTILL